jgi:hypothetical protein
LLLNAVGENSEAVLGHVCGRVGRKINVFGSPRVVKERDIQKIGYVFIVAPCILKSTTVHSPTSALFIKLGNV